MVDTSRALAVAVAAAVIYAAAGICLLHLAAGWLRRRFADGSVPPAPLARLARPDADAERPAPDRFARTMKWVRRTILALAALILLCVLYSRLVEPFWLTVERARVETSKLPPGARPVRLVLINDTHCDPGARTEERLPELVAELEPDAIIFAGDAVNSPEGLPVFRELMRRLAEVAPTYAVRGNWDVWWFPHLDFFGGTGVKVLDGAVAKVEAGGAEVWLAGFPVLEGRAGSDRAANGRVAEALLARIPKGRFKVLVHHYPEVAAEAVRRGADLGLGGDTHGGQIRLPLFGPLIRISRLGGYYDVGLHRVEGGHLYVNRGIGMEGGHVPRVRFGCPPEVTLIEIAPQGKN